MITEETHTCSEHYGQGGRKSGKWDVEQGSAVRGGGRAASVGRESQGDREGAERGIFDCSMPVFFFFKSTCKT